MRDSELLAGIEAYKPVLRHSRKAPIQNSIISLGGVQFLMATRVPRNADLENPPHVDYLA